MAFTDVIARLAVSLNLDTAGFQTGSRKAQQEVTGLQGHMTKAAKAIGGALAGMVSWQVVEQLRDMTKAAIDSAGGLGEQATQLGVSTKALQEYRFAATQVGLESGEMDQGLAQLTRRLGEAAQGSKAPADALKLLGLSIDQIKGKDAGDVIPLIAEGLAKIPDPGQRAAIAVDLFGKAGQKLMPLLEGGAAGVEAFRVQAEKLGVVLSSEEIAKADEVADKIAALNFQIEAQQNKKLLENSDSLLKYEESVGQLKLTLIDSVGTLQSWADQFDAYNARTAKSARENGTTIQAGFRQIAEALHSFADSVNGAMQRAHKAIGEALTIGREIVAGIARGIKQAPGAVWEALKGVITSGIVNAKNLLGIQSPSRVFMEIGAYIGEGLAIGIEGQSGRVAAATTKMTEAARRAAEETKALFDRLFPEIGDAKQYAEDLRRIDAAAVSDDAKTEARIRLARDATGTGGDVPLSLEDPGPLVEATKTVGDAFGVLRDRAAITTVSVAKSFKDMADETMRSLSNLANAIKGGGFLGILEAVVGLGLQLGSIGAFGKTIATRLNLPKRAMGGPVSANHPYLVGERGPELVVPQHSGRVIPNHKLGAGGGGNVYHIQGNLMTPEFWAMIQSGDERAAMAGAGIAQSRMATSRQWSLVG